MGISTDGTDMYMEWFPCSECAKSIADAGIKRLYCTPPDRTDREEEDTRYYFGAARDILMESGVEIIKLKD